MNIIKTIALIGAFLLSTTVHSEERVVLTQDDVCKIFLSDAVDLGVIYTTNQSKEEAAQWLIARAQEEPLHYVFFPGDLKIIDSLEAAKIQETNIVDFSVAVYNVCMRDIHDNPQEWLQEIPGTYIKKKGKVPSLLDEKSPKVTM